MKHLKMLAIGLIMAGIACAIFVSCDRDDENTVVLNDKQSGADDDNVPLSVGATRGVTMNFANRSSVVIPDHGDDYPWKDAPYSIKKCYGEAFGFCKRHCTSWVAHKVNQMWDEAKGMCTEGSFRNWMHGVHVSHAFTWKSRLQQIGYRADNNPMPGDVAYWGGKYPYTQYGHVAFVISVGSDKSVYIQEYNRRGKGKYSTRTIKPGNWLYPHSFIHVQHEIE